MNVEATGSSETLVSAHQTAQGQILESPKLLLYLLLCLSFEVDVVKCFLLLHAICISYTVDVKYFPLSSSGSTVFLKT